METLTKQRKIDWLPFGMLPVPLTLECWSDPDLRRNLIANPFETLRSLGYDVPEGFKIEVHENNTAIYHLVLPKLTTELEALSEDELVAKAKKDGKCAATGTCD